MKKTLLFAPIFLILLGCEPSQKEKEEIAIITCNIMGESRNMDASIRLKEINAAREEIGEAKYLSTDKAIKESFQYGLCKELVLNDPKYQEKLEEQVQIESDRLLEETKEQIAKLEAERIAFKKKLAEEKIAREKKEAEDRAKKEAEERAKKEAERIPKQKWRAVLDPAVETPQINYVEAQVGKGGNSTYIRINATCQDGIKTKIFAKFKGFLKGVNFERYNSVGYCGSRSYNFSNKIEDQEIIDKLELLQTYRTDKYYEYKILNSYIIKDVDVEVWGAWDPDEKSLDPRNFPPLPKSTQLNEPIKRKATFARRIRD